MKPGTASRTAEHNALFRALEARQPPRRRVVDDRLAESFLRWPLSPVARVPGLRHVAPRIIDGRWPGVRTAVVARTRVIDDALAEQVGPTTGQFVVLGAGYDTRVHRLPALAGLTSFEVDHPDTQAAKRAALGSRPDAVRYVATDFAEGAVAGAMAEAGYDESIPTLFLWEGTTNYLTEEAVDATLRWCARAAAGSTLVFTYVHRDVIEDPLQFVGGERLVATLDQVGERFTFGLHPDDTVAFLAGRGLTLESDIGAAAFRAQVYGVAADHIRGHEFYRVAVARIP